MHTRANTHSRTYIDTYNAKENRAHAISIEYYYVSLIDVNLFTTNKVRNKAV